MAASFSPRERALNFLAYWWVIAAAAILGGLIGLGVFSLKKPVFEAEATLTMGINFARTGILEQYDKDLALGTAAGIIYSTDVIDRLITDAAQQGINIDFATLVNSSNLERKAAQWTLRVRHNDPGTASFLTNHWLELGMGALDEAYVHALAANALLERIDSVEECLELVAANPVVPICPYSTLAELQAEFSALSSQYLREKQASRALFPEMTYQIDQQTEIPTEPVLYGRNNLVLAGLLIGFLIGIGLTSTDLPVRWFKRD